MLEGDRSIPVELEHGEEARDNDALQLRANDQLAEGVWFAAPEQCDDVRRLLPDADQWRVKVVESDGRNFARSESQRRKRREVVEADGPHQLGGLLAVFLLQPYGPETPARFGLELADEPERCFLESAVLEQAGEQQVARLEQCDILRVDQFTLRQETRDLEVEQRRRNHQELGCLVELRGRIEPSEVGNELVSHPAERDLGDVEFMLRDQGEQKVEWSAEVRKAYREGRVAAGHASIGLAPADLGSPGLAPSGLAPSGLGSTGLGPASRPHADNCAIDNCATDN